MLDARPSTLLEILLSEILSPSAALGINLVEGMLVKEIFKNEDLVSRIDLRGSRIEDRGSILSDVWCLWSVPPLIRWRLPAAGRDPPKSQWRGSGKD